MFLPVCALLIFKIFFPEGSVIVDTSGESELSDTEDSMLCKPIVES